MQTQKNSLLQEKKSLLELKSFSSNYSIYYKDNGKLRRIKIKAQDTTTVLDFIEEAIDSFSEKYSLTLSKQNRQYQLYAAKKNGQKCSDMPSLEKNHNICQTNLKNFFLEKNGYSKIGQEGSVNSIATEFEPIRGLTQQQERQQGKCLGFCTLF